HLLGSAAAARSESRKRNRSAFNRGRDAKTPPPAGAGGDFTRTTGAAPGQWRLVVAGAARRKLPAAIERGWIDTFTGVAVRPASRSLRAVDDGVVGAGARRIEWAAQSGLFRLFRPFRPFQPFRNVDRLGDVAIDGGSISLAGRMDARAIC